MPSGGFMKWGEPGPGQWITLYANGGHIYMVVAGLRFDTSGAQVQRHPLAARQRARRQGVHRRAPRRLLALPSRRSARLTAAPRGSRASLCARRRLAPVALQRRRSSRFWRLPSPRTFLLLALSSCWRRCRRRRRASRSSPPARLSWRCSTSPPTASSRGSRCRPRARRWRSTATARAASSPRARRSSRSTSTSAPRSRAARTAARRSPASCVSPDGRRLYAVQGTACASCGRARWRPSARSPCGGRGSARRTRAQTGGWRPSCSTAAASRSSIRAAGGCCGASRVPGATGVAVAPDGRTFVSARGSLRIDPARRTPAGRAPHPPAAGRGRPPRALAGSHAAGGRAAPRAGAAARSSSCAAAGCAAWPPAAAASAHRPGRPTPTGCSSPTARAAR